MKKHYCALFVVCFCIASVLFNNSVLNAQDEKAKAKNKFLVISELKDVYYTLSPEERNKLMAANTEYFNNAVKAGNIIESYSFAGWNRQATIEQYDNVEELYKHFAEDPLYPYIKFEVYPVNQDVLE